MILKEIENILYEIISKIYDVDSINLTKSNRPDLCDYQINEVFAISKKNSLNPIVVGEKIVEEINKYSNFKKYFKKVEFVKPGFINITLSDEALTNNVYYMQENEKFGLKINEHLKTYVIDYGGPNIAKPLHVGHMRPAIVGESIKRIIKYLGHNVISDVHYGDFGLQIGQVIYGMQKRNIKPEDVTLKDLNEIYPDISKLCKENDEIKEICAEITKELQDGDENYYKYYEKILEKSLEDIKRIYNYLDIDFDLWYGEMASREYIKQVFDILENKNLLIDSEGAKVVDVKEESDSKELPPLIFRKSNGAYLYGSTDMATIYQREKDFKPDYILYVTDLRQKLHFEQVFRASLKAGITDAKLEHLGFGTINGMDGKPYKTRSGETPKLDLLFNETKEILISKKEDNENMSDEDIDIIVNSILKFADLQNNRERDYIFDINKFSDVTGKTGPYILYTYLRINKILKDKIINNEMLTETIYNEYERDLKLKLLDFESVYLNAYKNRMPSYLADYIYELSVLVNSFYQNNHINGLEDEVLKNNWINLLTLTNNLIKEMLNLLAIKIPTKM